MSPSDVIFALILAVVFGAVALAVLFYIIKGAVLAALREHQKGVTHVVG